MENWQMPSALEQYIAMTGGLTSPTGTLGLTPMLTPPMPQGSSLAPNVPKFTQIGDRFAALGGFGDQPGELKTQAELQRMTQEEIDAYARERKQARGQGIAETLIRMGEAFQGKPASANALARMQARQEQELYQKQVQAFENALAAANPKEKEALSYLGPIGFHKYKQQEAIKSLGGREMFAGTGTTAQLYNVLLKGQEDPQLRSQPIYKTAYENLSRSTTETYINEQGQQVTRSIPGMINTEDYLAPIGAGVGAGVPGAVEEPSMADMMKPKDEEVVVEVSPERRKGLQSDLDVADRTISKIDNLLQTIIDIDPSPLTIGTKRAIMSSAYKDLQLELKNYAELGVLTGPDLALLEDWVGNPMGFWQLFSGGAEGTTEQAKKLKQSILVTKNKILEELGKETVEIAETPKDYYFNGRKIIVKNNKWVFQDDGTIVPGQ